MRTSMGSAMLLALSLGAWSQSVQAEMDFKSLKGAREFFALQEKYRYLSPEVPLTLLRQGKLNQDFIYGEENPITQLIRTSFHSSSENPAFFQVNPLAENIAKFMGPSVSGQLLGVLGRHEPGLPPSEAELKRIVTENPEFQEKIQEAAYERAKAEEALREYQRKSPGLNEIAELEQEIKAKSLALRDDKRIRKNEGLAKPEIKDCPQAERKSAIEKLNETLNEIFKPRRDEIEALESQLQHKKAAHVEGPVLKKLESAVKKVAYEEGNLDAFLHQLITAFHSEADPACPYPRHYTEQVLLSMAWLNGTEKKTEFLSLYHGLSPFMTEQGLSNLHDPRKHTEWLTTDYTADDYGVLSRAVLAMTPEKRAEHFLAHPEELGFLAHGRPMLDPNALPTIGFKQTPYEHPTTKAITTFPDCMEMATLNAMLNALAGGVGNTFDVATLEANLNGKGYTMHPGLKDFLTNYPDPSRVNEPEAHKAWAKLVSDIPGIRYNRPEGATHKYCEMFPTVSNALVVYEHLLFHQAIGDHPVQTLARSQKLTRICEVLSRKDRKVEWQLKGGQSKAALDQVPVKDTDLVLEFAINGRPKYDWRINSEHSQVDPKASDSSDWRAGVGPAMLDQILVGGRPALSSVPREKMSSISWLLGTSDTPKILERFKSERGSKKHRELLYSIPLETVEQKLLVIGELAEAGQVKDIEKLHKKLPDDPEAQRRFHAALADHHYPFKTAETSVAGATFTQVREPRLGDGLFWRDERGITWGKTLQDPVRKSDLKKNWQGAKNECLKFNKEESEKEKVRTILDRLDGDVGIKELRKAYFRGRSEERRAALIKKYAEWKADPNNQIQGCYLAPIEEFMLHGVDLGYQEEDNKFLPQFFADLYDSQENTRRFWSSSVSPFSAGSALYFIGGSGGGYYGSHGDDKSVVCVCALQRGL